MRQAPFRPARLGRRTVLTGVTGCAAAAALAACTPIPRSFHAPAGGLVRVPVSLYPELEQAGGTVKVLRPDGGALYVRRAEDGRYTALSAICTHQRCVVNPAGAGFRCPCHGSTYDRGGRNTGGPASRPLARFAAEREGEDVVVTLPG